MIAKQAAQGLVIALLAVSLHSTVSAQAPQAGTEYKPLPSDIPEKFTASKDGYDYIKRDVMIPMRDGVKLHTVIVIAKGAKDAPILLTRTPYNASGRVVRSESPHMINALPEGDELFVRDGYIRVFQDIRGKYGSEGTYVMTLPVIGPLNNSGVDEVTDAYDTIDWLVKNTPESNGRVGMLGSSYEGFTVVMALLNPHPALKVAAPESPMVDGWMGDDWFHYGAFRQPNFDYFTAQMTTRGMGATVPRDAYDDYETFLRAGSAGAYATAHGIDQLPWWQRVSAHPAYDSFWQEQALDKLIAKNPPSVPTMWEQGLWDQEDMWGAIHSYLALKAAGHADNNYLVMGPWRHSGANYNGSSLGPLHFDGDTGLQWRRDVLKPFFDQYLKDGAPKADTPHAFIYNTGENHWDRYKSWPPACEKGCANPLKPLYLESNFGLGFDKADTAGSDSFVSDPAKAVPYLPPPVRVADHKAWTEWLVTDQRFVATRPDVLVYQTPVLTEPVRVQGAPVADIFASITGTDTDWVVKLIDVYPAEYPSQPEMGGYQLPISLDIFRGRYRESFEHPSAVPANQPQEYKFGLPTVNHVFLPGHRIMVQIQSSAFPLYDRNPQTYVDNIFFAKPADYQKSTQTILRDVKNSSAILLPVVP
jgi:putative CocE/NonD family hydrolase